VQKLTDAQRARVEAAIAYRLRNKFTLPAPDMVAVRARERIVKRIREEVLADITAADAPLNALADDWDACWKETCLHHTLARKLRALVMPAPREPRKHDPYAWMPEYEEPAPSEKTE
jgi:hypothetical protein